MRTLEPVALGTLDRGATFRIAGDRPSRKPKVFRVVEHGDGPDPIVPVSQVVELTLGEQIDFAEPEPIPERWVSSTLVVPT